MVPMLSARPSSRALLWGALASLTLTFGVGCGRRVVNDALPTVTVTRGSVDVTLTVRGEIEAVESVKIVSPGGYGRLKITELIDEGTVVEAGDLLVRFDTQSIEDDLAEQNDRLASLRADYLTKRTELEGNLADLERGVRQSELALERAELGLTDSEAVARIERERSRLSVEDSRLNLEKAKQDLAAAKATGGVSLQAIESEVTQVMRRKRRIEEMLEKTEIHAPTGGVVILGSTWRGGRVAEGDEVWGGQTLIELPDLSEMMAVAYVHEMDASQVSEGQAVVMRLDAYPDTQYAGIVAQKASLATEQEEGSKVKSFRVEIDLEETTAEMKPGMTTRCDFQIGRADEVFPVPREAIVVTDEGPVVYMKRGRNPQKINVTLGVQNATHVAVEGISEGAEIFLGDPYASVESAG